ncbi:MAG TPA: ABC transporter ATP-binding protein [Candidatus Limnocylindria bacterium]|nr:ABC transporter ATP-binding protein [Candidatus Limnocylindria bacterium]
MSTVDHVIETSALTKRYGEVVAVNDLTLRVPRGGVFGFLGPNGSGKTTTMGMLLGLVHPSSGEARIFGDPARHPATLRRVGAMVETPTFYPYLSGRANLRYFQGIGRRGSPKEIDRLLDLVDLGKRADSKFATYSLGMKQRLGIACALLGDPELVFLDEPTNGLDPAGVVEVRELIRELGTDGRTVVLSSHLLAETELVCDNVAVLSRGRLIAQGTIRELLREQGALRIRTTDDAAARNVLATLPWIESVAQSDGALLVAAPQARSWEIGRALAERQIYLSELVAIHRTLEEFFMEITDTDPATGRSRT